jgi:apolipoprotein N-acyltransferase
MTLNPSGGHLGDGEGVIGFFFVVFFFTVGFFTVGFFVGVGVAFTVALTEAFGVGVGVFVAAKPWAGKSAKDNPMINAARFIDHSI